MHIRKEASLLRHGGDVHRTGLAVSLGDESKTGSVPRWLRDLTTTSCSFQEGCIEVFTDNWRKW